MPDAQPTKDRCIRSLPTLLVNQIAAGEVVERPASVVKELLDNAVDADATRVEVELEQGGIELVRVTDDGVGIPPGQLPLALAPHATSKIAAVEDLERVATMGFRGEALASIASVSRVSIRSRTLADVGASVIEAEGDLVRPVAPAPGPVGTSVTVRNLFFNTPARRKFLRTPATEQSRCADVVREAALARPALAFTLRCDGRPVLDLPADQSPRERIISVLGRELADQLIEVSAEAPGYVPWKRAASADETASPPVIPPMTIWGLVGRPSIARATAQAQHVFINGRPVRDRTIMHAIKEAYRGLLEPGRHATAVLLLDMDPAAVDVNVHPTKTEVRFRDSSSVHSLVLRSIQEALRRADLTPAVAFGRGMEQDALPGAGARGILPPATAQGDDAARRFADYFRRDVPSSAGGRLSFEAIRNAIEGQDPGSGPAATVPPSVQIAESGPAAPADPTLPTPVPVRPIIQVHNSYLVTQDEHGMLIIDQHALHERVMFEKLLERLARSAPAHGPASSNEDDEAGERRGTGGVLESQRLLSPIVVQASPAQVDALDALKPLFDRIGIVAEPSGPTSIAIHAFPTFLFDRGVDAGPFLSELLDKAQDSNFTPGGEETLHEVLDMMACKAAIKAGNKLSDAELAELISLRDRIERSSNCPHGRPTSIRVTIRELDKRFGRV
ncbi:MAG: DNA mismatch repair endonuclease MutL [Phycisphaerales bacterium]